MLTETIIEAKTPPRHAATGPSRSTGSGSRRTSIASGTCCSPASRGAEGPGGRRLLPRPRRAAPVEARHSRFRRAQRAAVRAHRLDGGLGPRPGARRRLLRASEQAPLPGRQFHPRRRQPRLYRAARRLPRRVRPCAAARPARGRRFHAGDGRRGAGGDARPGALHRLARLYWYSVEFGLAREEGETRIYGAGLLSSFGESRFALESPEPRRSRLRSRRRCCAPATAPTPSRRPIS